MVNDKTKERVDDILEDIIKGNNKISSSNTEKSQENINQEKSSTHPTDSNLTSSHTTTSTPTTEYPLTNTYQERMVAYAQCAPPNGYCIEEFQKGDEVYTCKECTSEKEEGESILCARCFTTSQHTQHRYERFHTSGGFCDCGDPSAWNQHSACRLRDTITLTNSSVEVVNPETTVLQTQATNLSTYILYINTSMDGLLTPQQWQKEISKVSMDGLTCWKASLQRASYGTWEIHVPCTFAPDKLTMSTIENKFTDISDEVTCAYFEENEGEESDHDFEEEESNYDYEDEL